MRFSGSDFTGFTFDPNEPARRAKPKKPRKAVKSALLRTLINLGVTLLFAALYFYIELPPLNIYAEEFYAFVFILCAVYCGCAVVTSGFHGDGVKGYFTFLKKQCKIPLVVLAALALTFIVGSVSSWVVIRAGSYRELLTVDQGDFAAEVDEISYDQIPMLDRASAIKLGDRKLGELADMVSQFEVAGDYTQINYRGRPVRVTPLEYGDIIKWFNNRSEGLPAYLLIDMVTQNVEVVRLGEGMRYTTAEHFGRNLYRYLRFNYPTYIFAEPVFEIDEEGTPYWVCAKREKTIGLFGGVDNNGAVLVNAITGECAYHEQVPSWVDHVYSAELIIQQYDYYGLYHNGFLNSIFGQRGVTVTTEGYNYLAIDDDVYMYTGVTSVGGDESNVGFLLSNQRTKQTKYYTIAGAEEYSAMASAEGQVQQMSYDATFPLLLNIAGQPTYFMALKDAAGLVKMYAMVNVSQYQIVATGTTVALCEQNYRTMLEQNGLIGEQDAVVDAPETESVSGVVEESRSAVLDGTTRYFLRLEGSAQYYCVSAADSVEVVILNTGDSVTLTYAKGAAASIIEGCRLAIE